ncbi:MAG: hypothetical protein GY865_13685, partial [candidate division Zixibacteria bacterium]|nr:hypothetical protein [candidate division Zixibacteria bacterium]
MRNCLLYLISLLLFISFITFGDELTINGFELPELLNKNWLTENDEIQFTKYPISFDLRFFLSDQGCIDSLKYDSKNNNEYIEGIIGSLKKLDFSPGKYLNKNIPVILPAKLIFKTFRYKNAVLLKLPYDSETNKKNGELVKKLLKDNSFSPAVVKKIPSYFCSFDEYADYG